MLKTNKQTKANNKLICLSAALKKILSSRFLNCVLSFKFLQSRSAKYNTRFFQKRTSFSTNNNKKFRPTRALGFLLASNAEDLSQKGYLIFRSGNTFGER